VDIKRTAAAFQAFAMPGCTSKEGRGRCFQDMDTAVRTIINVGEQCSMVLRQKCEKPYVSGGVTKYKRVVLTCERYGVYTSRDNRAGPANTSKENCTQGTTAAAASTQHSSVQSQPAASAVSNTSGGASPEALASARQGSASVKQRKCTTKKCSCPVKIIINAQKLDGGKSAACCM
jgi:hypothetical protein